MGTSKDVKRLLKDFEGIGWKTETMGGTSHIKLIPPKDQRWERAFYTAPSTTVNWHSLHTLRGLLKKAQRKAEGSS